MTIQSTVANCWELSNKNYFKFLQSASHNLLFLIYLPACFLPTYRTGHETGVLPLSLSSPHRLDHDRPLAGT